MNAVLTALARRRHELARRDDSGFILPLVLLVTIMVMLGTATMLGVVSNNAVPALKSQQQETALAAAQAGIQVYVAELNAQCSNYFAASGTSSVQECSWPAGPDANPLTSAAAGAPKLTGADYSVHAINTVGFQSSNDDDLRVSSTGTAGDASITLLADLSNTPSVLRISYFTNHESVSPDFLAGYFPARQVSIAQNSPVINALGLKVNVGSTATAQWNGLTAATAANCGALWYNDPSDTTTGGIGRGNLGSAGDSATETGTLTSLLPLSSTAETLVHPCSVAFTSGMIFNGPVYSHDAFYISDGLPGSGNGPEFDVQTACSTTVTTDCEPLPPASSAWSSADSPAAPTAPYRSVPAPGSGTPMTKSGVPPLQQSQLDVTLPSTPTGAAALAACTYTGATTIALTDTANGSVANISGPGAAGQSAACLNVPITKTTLLVNGDATMAANTNLGSGKLSVVATGDIIVQGNVTTSATPVRGAPYDELSVTGTAPAIDLVAAGSVRLAHVVTCADGTAYSATNGCPNDATGLYASNQAGSFVNPDGTLKASHPARQYCNASGDTSCGSSADATCDNPAASTGVTIDAAVFALTGSFTTDNYNRGCALGTVTVNGGVYTNYRGPLGQEWEVRSSGSSVRSFSGYKLNLNYVSLESAGLQYVPPLEGGTPTHPWQLISVSTPATGGN